MPIPTRAELKARFQTGDVPTQADFDAAWDAMYDMFQAAMDAAAAVATDAEEAVDVAEARAAKCFGIAHFAYPVWVIDSCTGGTMVPAGGVITVTFDVPMPDTDYVVVIGTGTVPADQVYRTALITKNINSVSFSVGTGTNAENTGDIFNFVIYR
jgi:hypothetical protein